ncbi:Zn-dependent protease (includes SpoIVFB) [Desulfonatronum thiosulfatophilum]|uniref:Zn-dependent protease (Includes SpoIVFB) n=1 Tax=Desulfonatronum thiosulfatophilum TaxID=617002 RepID=A0A1G6ETI9_9BACT|nr:site-2 protease family protein [Desulfonatronum thiosulfatophilum]SDB60718.1 Zn-dependent protease (includes SpoIVFB) [Desulfonatronum thiosulfatophilum]
MFDITTFIRELALIAVPVLIAITCHEAAHGFAAWRLGDPTARLAGRLTFNPVKHVDPIGTIAFPLLLVLIKSPFIFGWAKPVPVNPRYFQDPVRGMMLVSLAGPGTNFALAVAFAAMFHALIWIAVLLGGAGMSVIEPLALMARYGVIINLILGIFNLFPIPPLDGSKILAGFLPVEGARFIYNFERYGFIVLILLLMTGVLQSVLLPLVSFFSGVLL